MNKWSYYYDISYEAKFKGYYIETKFANDYHVHMTSTNCHYTFRKVPNYANGILLGKVWLNNEGETQMVNNTTMEIGLVKLYPYSKENPNRVVCIIRDVNKVAKYVISGTYTEELFYFEVQNPQRVESIDEESLAKLNLCQKKLLWKRNTYE